MNGDAKIPAIERIEFFNGQRLFAEDLQTLDGFNRQMRWLHNRSLHTFGIGSGFIVRAERGDREASIEPGYAIDNLGREIILLSPRIETIPPVADDGFGKPKFYDLTVHYPRTEDLEETETRFGVCSTNGVVRRREEPIFCWVEVIGQTESQLKPRIIKLADEIANGEKIVLARISVKNCKLETLSIANRRNVRPERLPYVACGKTDPDRTDWRAWRVFLDDGALLGAQVTVSTASAKFAMPPCYTARIAGKRLTLDPDFGSPPTGDFLLEGFVSIDAKPTPTEFTLRVLLPRFEIGILNVNPIDELTDAQLKAVLNAAKWHVEWMGVEG